MLTERHCAWTAGLAVTVAVLMSLVPMPSAAQGSSAPPPRVVGPGDPILMPWERKLRDFYRRQNPRLPDTGTDEALRKINKDPLARLGYEPMQPPPAAPENTAPEELGFTAPGVARLDSDRDGSISREEYFRGRDRTFMAPDENPTRRRVYLERLDSRFRYADRDNDGQVSPAELGEIPNARF